MAYLTTTPSEPRTDFIRPCPAPAPEEGLPAGDAATTPTDNSYRFVSMVAAPAVDTVAPLTAGSRWSEIEAASGRTLVSYSFSAPGTSVYDARAQAFSSTLQAFSAADQQLVRQALASIEAVSNVRFVEVPDDASQCGVIRYGYSQQPSAMNYAGYSFYPSTAAIGGDVWIATAQAGDQWNFYRPYLMLHETLHAMGLRHPFGGTAVLGTSQDIIPNTAMSYSVTPGNTSGTLSSYPAEPMVYDVAALQYLYGAADANSGDNVYDLAAASFQGQFRVLWDSAGHDRLDAGGAARGVTLDLNPGGRMDIGTSVTAQSAGRTTAQYTQTLALAAGARIEDAAGSGFDDRLTGNGLDNSLEGRGGFDIIDGGSGTDTAVYSGVRADYLVARDALGLVVTDYRGVDGTDRLTSVERLQFADGGVAFDHDAGTVAGLLEAVFGPEAHENAQYAGIGLQLLDAGMAPRELAQLAVEARFGAASAAAVVEALYANVTGREPATGECAAYVGMVQGGVTDLAGLALLAAGVVPEVELVGVEGLAYA